MTRTASPSTSRTSGRHPTRCGQTVEGAIGREMFERTYADVYTGDPEWRELPVPDGDLFAWERRRRPTSGGRRTSTAWRARRAPWRTSSGHAASSRSATPSRPTTSRRPGSIKPDGPAGAYLVEHGVERADFNSYGSRRGNHEVMVRGTFANVRLRNLLVPGSEGTWTVHLPSGEEMTIFEAAERYLAEGVPTIVLAGKEYGSGSSRDWAAKGPNLLGVRAVIAESYERIHRSNLLMMGILPLQFLPGESRESLGLTGREVFSVTGVENGEAREVTVRADDREFRAILRLDTPREREYVRHGGILPYVLRKLRRAYDRGGVGLVRRSRCPTESDTTMSDDDLRRCSVASRGRRRRHRRRRRAAARAHRRLARRPLARPAARRLLGLARRPRSTSCCGEAGGCAISLLAAGQEWLAEHFARGVPPIGMWHGIATEPGASGAPLLAGALGWLECALRDEVAVGTHTLLRRAPWYGVEQGVDAPALVRVRGGYASRLTRYPRAVVDGGDDRPGASSRCRSACACSAGSTSACSGATSASRCSSSSPGRSSCRRSRCPRRSPRSSSAAWSAT